MKPLPAAPSNADALPVSPTVWYTRPSVILPLLGLLVVISALLAQSPVATGREGDQRATTFSTEPMGAKVLYELARRIGWAVQQKTTSQMAHDSSSVLALIDPTRAVTASEAHGMLDNVRQGGALLVALGNGTIELADSLSVSIDQHGSFLDINAGVNSGGLGRGLPHCAAPPGQNIFTRQGLWIGLPTLLALKAEGRVQHAQATFIYSQVVNIGSGKSAPRPSVVGFPLGAGRVVVSADPDVFRNDALRECTYGFDVAVVRMLEYLQARSPRPRHALVFDEYHLERGANAGALSAVRNYLSDTSSGHALLQLVIAGLILLLAAATRVLPPRDDVRVDRRSPLEHVDALGRAYYEVGATRTGVQRLVRGVRRRADRTTTRAQNADGDELFLSRVAEIHPIVAADVMTVRNALKKTVTRDQFKEVGDALRHIEAKLTST